MAYKSRVSDAVVRRLPMYYRHLKELEKACVVRISSQELGERMNLTASQIRQDINCFGGFGQQGYGYHVSNLKERIAEILGLRWADVDWDNHCLHVRTQLQQRQKKGDWSYYLAPPKEGKERRVVLAPSVMEVLRKQQRHQAHLRKIAAPVWDNAFDLVFTNEFGKPLSRKTVYKHLKKALRKCGLEDRTFHSLRHSFATISLENGDDVKTVQTNLGHHAPSFTLKTYAHVSDRMQQRSAERMERLIGSVSGTP